MTTLSANYKDGLANRLRGNWKQFPSFIWYDRDELPDPENWCIYYTHSRDAELLEQSNAEAIALVFAPFLECDDIQIQDDSHWACGWVAGYGVRVNRRKKDGTAGALYTPAFVALCSIIERLERRENADNKPGLEAGKPILDKKGYAAKKLSASLDNIGFEGRNLVKDGCKDDWAFSVYRYLSKHFKSEMEDLDGRGAYPSEEAIATALHKLGLLDPDYLHLVDD